MRVDEWFNESVAQAPQIEDETVEGEKTTKPQKKGRANNDMNAIVKGLFS